METCRKISLRESLGFTRKYGLLFLASAIFLFITGCAGTSTFTAYPTKINPFRADLEQGKLIDLNQCLIGECQSKDLILYNMERGRIGLIMDQHEGSIQSFKTSISTIKENDLKAVVSASNIGANIAAIAVNDNAIPYEGDGYERVMLHHYQAINYLSMNNTDAAAVEFRLANAEQAESLKKHDKEIEDALKKAEDNKGAVNSNTNKVASVYAQMDEIAGRVKNSFQNAYSFYISGYIYEAQNQANDAYIDYKKALEIYPGNKYLQDDILRLATRLEMNDDVSDLKAKFKLDEPQVRNNKDGDVLVIFEDGFVQQKEEIKIPLPIPTVGIVALAFPIYKDKIKPAVPLFIEKENFFMLKTEPICDFRVLAVKALKEKVPMIVVRQVIRGAAKGAAAKVASDQLGIVGQLGASIWNYASENADLRSWITLPATAQVLRFNIPPGKSVLKLRFGDSTLEKEIEMSVAESGKTILHVVRTGPQVYTSIYNIQQEQRVVSIN